MRQMFVLITLSFLFTNDTKGVFTPGLLGAFVSEADTFSPLVLII